MTRNVGVAVTGLVVLALFTFAIPIRTWRTGELPASALAIVQGGPAVITSSRLWIDTDAACGHGRTTDPDDCFALLLLLRASGATIVGVSTVHGNASVSVTDSTTRALMTVVARDGGPTPPVHRGSADPMSSDGSVSSAPAHAALQDALAAGELTLVSLGPLTNIAAALRGRPDLQRNVVRLVAVMGRRPGHLFHPTEGAGGGMLFGHGPVFRDFNFAKDRAAATVVLGMRLPTTLISYEAARGLGLSETDLDRIATRDAAAAWVAARSREWLDFWKDDVGRAAFYPFDLMAAAYVLAPGRLDCAETTGWIAEDDKLWSWLRRTPALLVGPAGSNPADALATSPVVYCPHASTGLHDWLVSQLGGPRTR
ncbi:MAG: nucleoside hydrolase [Gemmatimonadaceae bacterium]